MKAFAILTLSHLLVGKAAATSPMAVSVSPSLASGNAQVFTATYSDDSGASVLNRRLFLIGSALTGSGTCFVQADPTGIYLVNDNDSGLLGPLTGSRTYSNSQCTLNGSGTSLVDVGTTSTLQSTSRCRLVALLPPRRRIHGTRRRICGATTYRNLRVTSSPLPGPVYQVRPARSAIPASAHFWF